MEENREVCGWKMVPNLISKISYEKLQGGHSILSTMCVSEGNAKNQSKGFKRNS